MGALKRAWVSLRDSPYYRRGAFESGLKRHGYEIAKAQPLHPQEGDLLICWNRYAREESIARRYEEAGASVIVAENGYIGTDEHGKLLIALAHNYHSGAGHWVDGPEDRWAELNIELRDWREDGEDIVIMPQRGLGPKCFVQPLEWARNTQAQIQNNTLRHVRIRSHPGKSKAHPAPDLDNAHASVIWASGAGIKSIVHGVPVFHGLQQWIGNTAAIWGHKNIEKPFLGDRLPMLKRMAWAQWRSSEIAEGKPFEWLLG